jgi:hypothetical protein
MTTCTIRASYARLAATCRASNDIRYYLRGLLVEPRKEGGAYIIGSDGHTLMAVIDEKAKCDAPVIIQPDKRLTAMLPKIDSRDDTDGSTLELTTFQDKPALLLTLVGLKSTRHLQLSDAIITGGNFPDWRKVTPDFTKLAPGHKTAVNPLYVSRVLSAFTRRLGRPPEMQPFQIPSEGPLSHSPVVYQIGRHTYAMLIVMPIRFEFDGTHDQWSKRWEKARQKPAASSATTEAKETAS